MKILVAVKRVIDHAIRIRVKPDGSGVETANLRMSMNPFDRHAVEAAVRLAEAGKADEIVVVSIGPKAATDVILSALAMGAHRGLLLETDVKVETLAVAKLLRHVVDEEKPDLVLLGKQAVDDDSNHVGQMLAGLLGWPQATFASGIELDGTTACVTLTDGRTWPDVLARGLAADSPRPVWLNNAGIDGHSTFGHQILLETHLKKFRPDFIVFLVGVNDVGREDLNDFDMRMLTAGLSLRNRIVAERAAM